MLPEIYEMKERKRVIIIILFATLLDMSYGCRMEGVTQWALPVTQSILDTFEGTVINRSTSDIEAIINISYGEATIAGPYFELSIVNSQFVIQTNTEFRNYEENEVASRVSLTIDFRCTGGSSNRLPCLNETNPYRQWKSKITEASIVWIDVRDTNNNPPRFLPTDEFEYVVVTPLPPGFLVTGCFNDITVRDIDLTTQRIDFTIEDNPYFEIEYDPTSSTVAKEFKAQLRTTTFIRSLSEPIALRITATDVDGTNDPPLSTTAVVRIVGDSEFQFPEEPVFGHTFYLANYTDDHQLNWFETISLQQGFDEYVNFTLEGDYLNYFALSTNRNQVSLVVTNPLPKDVWPQRQIYLIVRAEREFTSGDSATVIVKLPEELTLQFERVYYKGTIMNNSTTTTLQLASLSLSQGYEGVFVTVEVVGEFSTYFTATVRENLVTLTMALPIDDIIHENNFISLQVVATSDRSVASTVVNLEIVKDDNVTPVFDKTIYSGIYNQVTGLTAEEITLIQGFDETVTVQLAGEYANYFQINHNGSIITLTSSPIPTEIYSQQNILVSIEAIKPRTVGANAVIQITLPAARELAFDEHTYRGTIEGSELLLQTILLRSGYEEGVNFTLSGDYANYFTATNIQDRVDIVLSNPLPDTVITQMNVIILTLTASGLNAITTSASILLDIIKNDKTTPVFSQSIYYGTYSEAAIEIEAIKLTQGFDDKVSFRLDGAHAQYFTINNDASNVTITLQSPISEDVIFSEKFLLFNVFADKALTVGANAAVLIKFPTELTDSAVMRFSQNTYVGTLEKNEITLENIVLVTGFAIGTEFVISGEYAEHFALLYTNNVVQLYSLNTLPNEVVEEIDFIVLEIEARRQKAVSVWTSVVIAIVKEEVVAPMFSQAYYTGGYTEATGLTFKETISLSEGYDETVTFALDGESASWFSLSWENNSLFLVLKTSIPVEVLENKNQLMFIVLANKPNNINGRAVISIDLPKDFSDSSFRFYQDFYKGYLKDGNLTLNEISLGGYTSELNYTLAGDYVEYFQLTNQNGSFTLQLEASLPTNILEETNVFVLTLLVQNTNLRTYTVIIIENIRTSDNTQVILEFEKPYYVGAYSESELLQFDSVIRLASEIDQSVEFALEGEDTVWFGLVRDGNSVTMTLTSLIPEDVLANNQQLVFVVTAQSSNNTMAKSAVVISLINEFSGGSTMLGFDSVTYLGSINNNQSSIPAITLSAGFTREVAFTLHGQLANYFTLSPQGAVVTVVLQGVIPEQSIPTNRIIVLEIQATALQTITAYATIVIEYVIDEDVSTVVELIFTQTFYSGSYTAADGLSFPTALSLKQGYDVSVQFALEGDNAQWFGLVRDGNSITVTLTSPIPAAVLANNQQLVFVVTAQKPGSTTARSTVIISLTDEFPEGSAILGFDRVSYLGSIENNQSTIPAITLSEGFTQDVAFSVHGDLANYFSLSSQGAVVTVVLRGVIPEQSIPANRIIVLEIQATAPQTVIAYATIVIEYVVGDNVSTVIILMFAQTFYSGSYTAAAGLSFPTPISLTQGYDANVEFALEGDNVQWFGLVQDGNSVTILLTSPIPAAILASNQQLIFVVTAQRSGSATAKSTVIITLHDDSQTGLEVTFEKVLFEGIIQNGVVNHETITLTDFSASSIELHGEYSSLFVAEISGGVVTVTVSSSLNLPTDVSHVALELRAGNASAVLLLNVIHTDGPTIPVVAFSSPSYAVRVEITYTGLVGQVQASADNGEAVTYSLQLYNAHLKERLTINNEGELHLSAPANTGFYTFNVVATTIFTHTRGTATVHLSVEAITVCGEDLVMPPLIVLDVDEEEPHYNLINGTQYDNCHFTLTNRWPLDQAWLYVDEGGLHTTAIDREHESIAFMPLSQVQVEIILNCEGNVTRAKRSLTSDALGPYDYGNNKWILTDTIFYNSRRSLVNVIVNDINDNAPIFVGKENEPIALGYPIPELAERVLPRSLAELQATDADIGKNAALLYWSSATELAVSPSTGFVHLRNGATLENGARLTVHATDRNGEGLTGSIDILVRLLDESYIAVVTVKNAFLDEEQSVLSNLTDAIGYEVKVLRSVVISDETFNVDSRKERDVTSAAGASLQLYVYGLIAREPVSVDRLTADINNIVIGPVIVASSVSLQDHLEGQEICVITARDTGLLVATIVLSVLLFIVLVLIAVWFFLRWKKNRNYDEFTDQNSLASRNESFDKFHRPETLTKPRLDIGELKKSERRLQEMLDTPIHEVSFPITTTREDAILDMPMPELNAPIVIQSIDKLKDATDESSEDEFGETKTPKRKSVVTFNENVEKIIHVEDNLDPEDLSADPDYEVYKL